ncbi:hypothetical protein MVEN_00122900 [Mycena venus]|uniref:DUF6532 domain-containing protein n=1 Tax=Mycena venus TaxID=2733690 RepID=A0A8H6Z953_9AGAR|nr:hypothetical protein MVEN_00122900 [Mycena venus]
MEVRRLPDRKFSHFFVLFGPKICKVTVTGTQSVQFTGGCHPSPEHLVGLLQYTPANAAPPRLCRITAATAWGEQPPSSRDDLSGNQVFTNRTRDYGQRKPSGKQDQTDMENLEATQKKIQKLQKEVEKVKQLLSQQSKAAPPPPVHDDGPESEEPQSDGEDDGISFQSSITPLAPLPSEPPRLTNVVRRLKSKTQAPPKTSSRAYLAIPEVPSHGNDSDDPEPLLQLTAPWTSTLTTPRHDGAPSFFTDRGRSTTGNSGSAGSGKRPQASSPAPPPPAKRKRQDPQFAEGYVAIARAKPKATDYEPAVNALLIRAMAEYSMLILTINAFPAVTLQLLWAKQCFSNACRAADERFKITDRIIKLITKRGSHMRSQIITVCRTLFAPHYKFNRTSNSTATINANRDLSEKLADGAVYHYKDVDAGTGYWENSILADVRKEKIFKDKDVLGCYLCVPLRPLPTPNSCIGVYRCTEFSTGKFVAAEFTEKEMVKNYATHLNDIQRWADMNKNVVDKLRHKWLTRAIFAKGPSDAGTHINEAREDALRAELAGRTGDTDSESEEA